MIIQGITIQPNEDVIYSLADAEVAIAFEAGHTYGLKTSQGTEILLYIGIDAVFTNDDSLEQLVKHGKHVKRG
ncbi:PTS glucose transporter subunit IIA [Streptococcus merionis]|uniref:Sucrose-specific phosphotransferase system (PTS), IIABC component n=1 Tax=Streptococcus merionis TaxID=400065 RepID=A0A239SST8_9STRE|nr:PTS glucose transporter subunit IIA [Streptococcus merionis]SNU87703.1 sucrose-specific phosphotransferase system (PTS), IIABC component [Streptococcus merionis]